MRKIITNLQSGLPPGIQAFIHTGAQSLQLLPFMRFFLFDSPAFILEIDFIQQSVVPGCLYFVPPLHYYALQPMGTGRYLSINTPPAALKPQDHLLLHSLRYRRQKALPALPGAATDLSFTQLETLLQSTPDGTLLQSTLCRWLHRRIARALVPGQLLNNGYPALAQQLLQLLHAKTFTLNTCRIPAIAEEMLCSERNLHRVCMAVFGTGPKQIINAHLVTKSVYLLLQPYPPPIKQTAYQLGFSGSSAFAAFLRKHTGHTPSGLQRAAFFDV
jgi:AraC-like DNA-binding protein